MINLNSNTTSACRWHRHLNSNNMMGEKNKYSDDSYLHFAPMEHMGDAYIAQCWNDVFIYNNAHYNEARKLDKTYVRKLEAIGGVSAFRITSNDDYVGYLEINTIPNTSGLYIRQIVIKPDFRGQGIATCIIKALIDSKRWSYIELEPTAASTGFWNNLGFTPVKEKNLRYTILK